MEKKALWEYIDKHAKEYIETSHRIWEYAELSLQEFKSAALYKRLLKKEGFQVVENLANIETAFCGIFAIKDGQVVCPTANAPVGTTATVDLQELPHPIVAILAEFDALSGLSQKAGIVLKEPVASEDGSKCANGHGCGHNMLGAASYGAACAVKNF